jgi:hypothetical protein
MIAQKRFNKGTKVGESAYDKLDAIFEGIMGLDEAEYPDTISTYLQKMFTQYMQGVNTKDPKVLAKVKEIADAAMNSYKSDKGKKAITQLANLGYSLSYSHGGTQGVASDEPMTPGQALMRGVSQGLGMTSPTTAGASQSAPTKAATPQQQKAEQSVYMQVKGLLDKLDKKGKQRILAALEKQLGTTGTTPTPATPDATTASTADTGANAFAQMGQQLTKPGAGSNAGASTKTSTGGKVQSTGLGQVHTKSRANANIKRRTPATKTAPTATAPAKKAPAWKGRSVKPVTNENKRK